jgi:voltage-gated sodium channel
MWDVCSLWKKRQVYQQSESSKEDYFYNPELHEGIVRQYLLFTSYSRRLVQNDNFNYFIIFVICVAGVNVGIQTYDQMADNQILNILDLVILMVFSFEVVVKILSEGLAPQQYFLGVEWKWNNFDFGIVFMSLPFWGGLFGGGSLALLRLVRLMRLAKLIRKIPALQVIVKGLTGGLASIGYIMILLFLVFYLFAVAGFYVFGKNDPFHFGTLPVAMMTMFRCSTLDAWSDVMYLNIYGCDGYDYLYVSKEDQTFENRLFWCENPKNQFEIAAIYFVVFTIISALVMLSLFIGAVTLSMTDSLNELKRFADEKKKEKRLQKNINKLLGNAALLVNKRGKSSRGMSVKSMSIAKPRVKVNQESPKKKNISNNDPSRAESPATQGEGEDGGGGGAPFVFPSPSPSPEPLFPGAVDQSSMASQEDDGSISTINTHNVPVELTDTDKRKRSIAAMPEEDREHLEKMMAYLEHRRNSIEHSDEDDGDDAKPMFSVKRFLPEWVQEFMDRNALEKAEEAHKLLARRLKIGMGQEAHGIEDEPKDISLFISRVYEAYTFKNKWLIIAEHCKFIAESSRFVNFVTLVICLAGVNVGAQTDPRITGVPAANYALNILDIFILSVFTLEVVVKIAAEGLQPWVYFKDGWNKFDFIIVVGSYTPGAGSLLTILRLLRLLRVLKLVKSLPQLAVIVNALLMGMSSIGYIGLILFLCFYIFAILGMMLFRGNDPFHFGNLHIAMFTLFRCSTLDDWSEVMYVNVWGCDLYGGVYDDFPEMCTAPNGMGLISALYFNVFIMIGAQVLLTLFIGVVTTSMEQAREIQDAEMKIERQLKSLSTSLELTDVQVNCFRQVYDELDSDNYGTIDGEQLASCFESIEDLLEGVDIEDEVKRADPGNKGIDIITFIVVLCNIPKCRHKRVLRRAVRRWKINKRKKGLFFFKRPAPPPSEKEENPKPKPASRFHMPHLPHIPHPHVEVLDSMFGVKRSAVAPAPMVRENSLSRQSSDGSERRRMTYPVCESDLAVPPPKGLINVVSESSQERQLNSSYNEGPEQNE